MIRRSYSRARRRRAAGSSTRAFDRARSSRLSFERLEPRQLLTVDLTLAGGQSLVANANINVSNDPTTTQHGLMIDINPANPLQVAGVSNRGTGFTTLDVYRSADGGATWSTTVINDSVDALAPGAFRFGPSVAYDSQGRLYVAYSVIDGGLTSLIVARSLDNGATFPQATTVDTQAFLGAGLQDIKLTTGPDGMGGQAIYVAYIENSLDVALATDQTVMVAASNNAGLTFGAPVAVNGGFAIGVDDLNRNANVSVGPAGQLYLSWFDVTESAVLVDRDLDGLTGGLTFGADITVVDEATARPVGAGNFDLFSDLSVPAQPTKGIGTSPALDVDRSGGSTDGNLYIVFADRFGGNDTDLWVARSTNQGAAWTIVSVNRTTATEFLPAIDVDQSSGSVNVLFYSTEGDTGSGNDDVNVRIKTSIDGGATFPPDLITSTVLSTATSRVSAATTLGNDFLDTIGLAVRDGTIQALWSDNRGLSTDLEAFTASASFNSATNANELTITGDETGVTDDLIVIRRSAANSAFVEVLLNNDLRYAGLIASLDKIKVNGLGGNDDLTIDSTLLPLTIDFVGGAGASDRVFVNDDGQTDPRDYRVNPTSVAVCVDVLGVPTPTTLVTFDPGTETVQVDGTDGVNRFDVTPSMTATYIIDGNDPTTRPGDFLSVRFAGTTGRTLTYDPATGNGMWTFTSGHKNVNFLSIELLNSAPLLVYGADAAKKGKPTVVLVDAELGTTITSFLAYEATYKEGVRVALGDVTGDGVPEIITAPGRNHTPLVKVFDLFTQAELFSFLAYPASFKGGVMVAVGDVDADGLNDIVVTPSRGKVEVRTFINQFDVTPATPFDTANMNRFLAFSKKFIGGASVAVGNVVGTPNAEIIVGAGGGTRNTVRLFDGLSSTVGNTVAPILHTILPFAAKFRGGVFVSIANTDVDVLQEIVIGAGVGGQSQLAVFDQADFTTPTRVIAPFNLYSGSGSNAPLRVATTDLNSDGLVDDILVAQGPDGLSLMARRIPAVGAIVDLVLAATDEFKNGYYIGSVAGGPAAFIC